ncbi:partner of bursicon-like [Physella acuta]|uniref:partner of bursicon-like n=1 Tax=Physella acuta TaxID=109671 RepID=UPI0027DB8BA2|nr:partner of bursicon-like [Physella acuta]XP_059168215.1 partner of bursicon-like [Physella acuta]
MVITSNICVQSLQLLLSLGLFPGFGLTEVHINTENDDCRLLTTIVPITRQMTINQNGRPINAMCIGQATLNKCEGMCESSVTPSVNLYPGFKKNCRCCKEKTTESKEVLLTQCYKDKTEIMSQSVSVVVKDITSCQCERCEG